MDNLEFDLLYPNDEDVSESVLREWVGKLFDEDRDRDELPEEWEMQLANAEPHNIPVTRYVGYGDEAEEREIEVEVRPGSRTSTEATR